MKFRLSLIVLVLYLTAGVIDGVVRVHEATAAGQKFGLAALAVAYCAGLFWPIDLVARLLLTSG